MTSPGMNLGNAYVDIEPDVDFSKFAAAGRAAGDRMADGMRSSLSAGARRAYDEVSRAVNAQFKQFQSDQAFLTKATANAAAELNRQYGTALNNVARGFSSLRSQSVSASESVGRDWGRVFSRAGDAALRMGSGAISALQTVATSAGQAVRNVFSGAVGAASSLTSGIASIGSTAISSFGRASDSLRNFSSHVGIASFQLQILGGMLTSMVTGPLVAAGVGLAKWGLQTAMNVEDAQIALRAILPPGYDVAALIERLQKLSVESPVFNIEEIFTFTRTLAGAGIEAQKVEPVLAALNKIFITYGVTGERASKALLGVSQVFQKGRAYAEEFNQQIGEQLPIWQLLSQATGKTQDELRKMVTAGELTSDVFAELLIKVGDLPSVTQGATEGVSSLSAQLAIMKEEFQQMLAMEFLKFFPEIKAGLDRLRPSLEQVALLIVAQIPKAIQFFGQLIDKLLALKVRWDALTPGQQEFIKNLGLLVVAAGPALLVLGGIATAFSSILGFASMLLSPWGILVASLVGGLGLLGGDISLLKQNVLDFGNAFWSTFSEKLPGALEGIKSAWNESLLPAINGLLVALGFPTLRSAGEWLGTSFAELAIRGLGALADGMRLVGSAIEFLTPHVSNLKSWWDQLDGSQRAAIVTAGAFAATAITMPGLFNGITSSIGGVSQALLGMFSTNPMLLVMTGMVAGLGAAFIDAYRNNETFRQKVNEFVKGFKEGFEKDVLPALRDLWQTFREKLLPAIADFIVVLGGGDPKTAGENFAAGIGYAIGAIDTLAKSVAVLVKGLSWMVVGFHLARAAAAVFDAAMIDQWNRFTSVWNAIAGTYNKLPEMFRGPTLPMAGRIDESVKSAVLKQGADSKEFADKAAAYLLSGGFEGTKVGGFAGGGIITGPGSSTSDSILARLSNGEFAVNAAATSQYRPTLEAINGGASPGVVMATLPSIPGASSGFDSPSPTLMVTLVVDGQIVDEKIAVALDANNQATINVARAGRRTL